MVLIIVWGIMMKNNLFQQQKEKVALKRVTFYHCDQMGTPQKQRPNLVESIRLNI